MTFALSGSTVTQSGTDTSYAGLNGLAGVTRLVTGTGYLYYMPTLVLSVTGTLTIADPSKDTVICSRYSVTGTGNVTSGSFAADGVTPLTAGAHFSAITLPGVWSGDTFGTGSFEVASSGRATFIGGSYEVGGNSFIANGAIIREYGVDVVALSTAAAGQTASDSTRIRAYGADVIKRNCRHFDIGYDLFRMPTEYSVKAFGAVYVSQYVGSLAGGADAKFTASALSNVGGTQDFDNWGAGWVELYNCAKGANLSVGNSVNRTNHCVPLYQDINFTVTDLAGTARQNVRLRCIDAPVSNSPTTTITTTGNLKTWDFRNAQTYTGTTDAAGKATLTPVLQVWHGASNLKNLRFPSSTATIRLVGYSVRQQDVTVVLGSDTAIAKGVALVPATGITLTEAQAAALTGISLVASGTTSGTLTVTATRLTGELWQFWRNFKGLIANADSADSWEYVGVVLNTGAWNVTNSGTITGGITTTGTITNSGTLSGEITGNVTNTGALASGTSITGNVTQATPTDLTGVSITGNLAYNTNTPITITLTNCTITGTVSNTGTGVVSVNLVNSTITTGANVTAQYPITISDADNRLTSFHVWVFNSSSTLVYDSTFQSQVASVTVNVPVGGSLRVYSQPYGFISRIVNTSDTSPTLKISHVPETLVDTSISTAIRDEIESHFSSVLEDNLLYVEADADLAQYTPAQALTGLHYFIVNRGFLFSTSSLAINSVDSVKLIDGGFRVYNAGFRGRAKSTLNATNTPSLFITLPLYIEDASGVAGNQVFVRNANGIAIVSALWTKATANISNNDISSIATRVDQSSILAKQATLIDKASQASVTSLGAPMQASAYVEPDNTGIADIKSKTDKLVFNSQNYVASNIYQIETAPLADIRSGLATLTNVTDAQTAIVAEVNANETKIDAIKTETAGIKTKVDTLQNTDLTAVNTALTDIKGTGYDATKHNLVKIKQQASLAAALSA